MERFLASSNDCVVGLCGERGCVREIEWDVVDGNWIDLVFSYLIDAV